MKTDELKSGFITAGMSSSAFVGEIIDKPAGGSLKPSQTAPPGNHIFGLRNSISSLRDKRQSL